MESLASSNIFQLFLTASAGAGGYLAWRAGLRSLLPVLGYGVCAGIVFGALTGLGETYVYSDFYRRSFFVFGDIVPLVAAFVFLYAVVARRDVLAILAATACLFASGKAALVLLVIMAGVLVWLHRFRGDALLSRFARAGGAAAVIYAACIGFSAWADLSPDRYLPYLADLVGAETRIGQWLSNAAVDANHRGACPSVNKCLETQVASAWEQRYLTSLAGLWMAWQGGFHGDDYPNSANEFADIMVRHNPFGLNETYDLNRRDWYRMGQVQNPYLAFGAGYGLAALAGLLCLFLVLWLMAAQNLAHGERGAGCVFAVFFMVVVALNQTQSWLQSGSFVLVLNGFCGMHILLEFARRRMALPGRLARPIDRGEGTAA
jgi:hypothetical protein